MQNANSSEFAGSRVSLLERQSLSRLAGIAVLINPPLRGGMGKKCGSVQLFN